MKFCKNVNNVFFSTQQNRFFTSTKTFACNNQNVLNKMRFVVLINSFLWVCGKLIDKMGLTLQLAIVIFPSSQLELSRCAIGDNLWISPEGGWETYHHNFHLLKEEWLLCFSCLTKCVQCRAFDRGTDQRGSFAVTSSVRSQTSQEESPSQVWTEINIASLSIFC